MTTKVGYTGGTTADPTYEQVCSDRTGHAEAVEVWFDPALVSYDELLERVLVDPRSDHAETGRAGTSAVSTARRSSSTTPSRSDWRSPRATSRQASLSRPIVTQIVPASPFYDAEEYHQRYFEKHGGAVCATTLR